VKPAGKWLALLVFAGSLLAEGCRGPKLSDRKGRVLAVQKDALGREVSVRQFPRRIVSTAPSNTEILLYLGLKDRLVGITSFYGSPDKVEGIPLIGGYINPSVARIVALHPDIVFAARGNPTEVVEQLRRLGIKVFTLDTRTVAGLLADIRKIGALSGADDRAEELISEIKRRVSYVSRTVAQLTDGERPRVLWVGQEEPLRTAGSGSLVDELIELAGGKNVARDEERPWPSYGMEKVVLRDPEVIILGEDKYKNSPRKVSETIAMFKSHAVWGKVSAVKEGRVHFIATDLLGQPSPACVEGLELLARLLHPRLFAEHPEKRSREEGDDPGD